MAAQAPQPLVVPTRRNLKAPSILPSPPADAMSDEEFFQGLEDMETLKQRRGWLSIPSAFCGLVTPGPDPEGRLYRGG